LLVQALVGQLRPLLQAVERFEQSIAKLAPHLILPRFHVHQIVDNSLMNGGTDGQEGIGTEAGVHGGVQG
jgi:hypothetical protein